MKLLILYLAAASAVTVYRKDEATTDEDSMALETNSRTRHQRGSITHADRQARLQDEDSPTSTTQRQQKTEVDQQKSGSSHRPRQQRPTEGEAGLRSRRQHQYTQPPGDEQPTSPDSDGHVFQTFHQVEDQGAQKLGYSSFIQHHEEDPNSKESNIDIKKVAPKSSVQVQIYHNEESPKNLQQQQQQNHQQQHQQQPQQQQQQLHRHLISQLQQKEAAHAKQKYTPPKIYTDALSTYKKNQQNFQPNDAVSFVDDHELGLSAYLTPTVFQPAIGQPVQLRQLTPQQPGNFASFHDFTQSATDNRANHELFPPFSPQQLNSFRIRGKHEQQKAAPETVDAKINPETISVSMSPSWKTLTENLEIATSDEASAAKGGKVRRPKEAPHSLFAGRFTEHENFKAQRFDHEKALRSSTPFGVNNVMSGLDGKPLFQETSESQPQVHEDIVDTRPFRFSPKVVEAQLGATNNGAITFHTGDRVVKVPKTRTVKAGSLDIPVLTHEEYTKHFGHLPKKQEKTRPVRFTHDGRIKNLPSKQGQGNHASSFSQFNALSSSKPKQQAHQAFQNQQLFQSQQGFQNQFYQQKQPQFKPSNPPQQHKNVDVFPSLAFSLPSRRNVSLVPERHGRVLPEYGATSPQQFSVSASYKIDRSLGQEQ